MLERVISWSLAHRAMVIAAALAAATVGFYSLGQLNIDAFPDTTSVPLQINTVAPAMAPDEIERLITFPIELAMGGHGGTQTAPFDLHSAGPVPAGPLTPKAPSLCQFGRSALGAAVLRRLTRALADLVGVVAINLSSWVDDGADGVNDF